jgi:hypothetical protein
VLAMTFGQSSYTSFFDNDQIACRNQRLLTWETNNTNFPFIDV